jgi:hypothetical protein
MRENHGIQMDLKRIRDFTGNLRRISTINSEGRYGIFISICIVVFFFAML